MGPITTADRQRERLERAYQLAVRLGRARPAEPEPARAPEPIPVPSLSAVLDALRRIEVPAAPPRVIAPVAVPGEFVPPRVYRTAQIQAAVCRVYGVSRTDLISARRSRDVIEPRHVAMYLARRRTLRSLPEIGRLFGGRDHTTVFYAVRKIEERIATDPAFAFRVAEIESGLGRAQG